MVGAMPGCAWGWLRPRRAGASRAAQAGGLGKREAAEPSPCLSHRPGVHRCGINHLDGRGDVRVEALEPRTRAEPLERLAGSRNVRLSLAVEVLGDQPLGELELAHGGPEADVDGTEGSGCR